MRQPALFPLSVIPVVPKKKTVVPVLPVAHQPSLFDRPPPLDKPALRVTIGSTDKERGTLMDASIFERGERIAGMMRDFHTDRSPEETHEWNQQVRALQEHGVRFQRRMLYLGDHPVHQVKAVDAKTGDLLAEHVHVPHLKQTIENPGLDDWATHPILTQVRDREGQVPTYFQEGTKEQSLTPVVPAAAKAEEHKAEADKAKATWDKKQAHAQAIRAVAPEAESATVWMPEKEKRVYLNDSRNQALVTLYHTGNTSNKPGHIKFEGAATKWTPEQKAAMKEHLTTLATKWNRVKIDFSEFEKSHTQKMELTR
jgi:hypothetical protein